MKDIKIQVNHKGAISLEETCKLLESQKSEDLKLVRSIYPYKFPTGYIKWSILSAVVASGIIGNRNRNVHARRDLAGSLNCHKLALWFTQHAPVYCLRENLLESLLNTDITDSAEILKDLEPTIPTFILLFPKDKIISPEGSAVEFCVIHLSKKNQPEYSQGKAYGVEVPYLKHDHPINMHWSAIENEGIGWYSGTGLTADGKIEFSNVSVGQSKINQNDINFLAQMRSIVLQVFLLLQYEPDILKDVRADETPTPKVQGFQRQKTTEKFLYPRWIDEPVRKARKISSEARGTHASPVTHWRRGHWKTVPCGEGRADRKWVRIAPTMVNP